MPCSLVQKESIVTKVTGIPIVLHKGVTFTMQYVGIADNGFVRYRISAECTDGTFSLPRSSVLLELANECKLRGFTEESRGPGLGTASKNAYVTFITKSPRRPHLRAAYLAAVSTRMHRYGFSE